MNSEIAFPALHVFDLKTIEPFLAYPISSGLFSPEFQSDYL